MQCANCGFTNDSDAEFCENCGSALAWVCGQCGNAARAGSRFCKKCGAAVGGPSSPASRRQDPVERRQALATLQQSAPSALREKIHASAAQTEGERKPVTIMFTDIVGSTSLAEKLDPEEWKEIVSGAHQRVSEVVYRYEGTIAQLLGDGVLAFFGAPITHEDDPERAVRAGLELQRSVAEYAGHLRGYVDNFQLRVGIHTGTVVVGQVGGDLHMEYLAVGGAVNLAARLQAAARPGAVLISAATEHLVKAAFTLEALGAITLKGIAEPVHVFEVVAPKAGSTRGHGLEGLSSPLVGRDREQAAVVTALNELAAGRGQIVSVLGEAGIGKTRLVEEGRHAGPAVRWLEGRALSYGQALPFWTIMQLIKADLGVSETDPEARIKVALRRRVKALFGEQAGEALPRLALVLGVDLEAEASQSLRALDEAVLKRQIHQAIVDYVARLADEQPTVLVFEDLHWADPSTLQVLEGLMALTDRVPLLLLLLARTERDQDWWAIKVRAETDYAHRYTELALKPLTAGEQSQLVDNLLEVADLPNATRRLLLERSEGNPFYLEEVIRSLIEQGALVHEDRRWRATDHAAGVQIPDTLQGVLLARLDRLDEDVRRTLQAASVIGKSFLYRLLDAVAEAGRQLDAHLYELQRVDLVLEKARRPDLEYIFKHSLTQAAAYDSLLMERRKDFHRRVGLALEGLYADRCEEIYGLLAHHFGQAGELARALEYATKAGDHARELFAYREAIDYYQQALSVLQAQGEYERAARTLMKIGLLYHTIFDFPRSQQAYEAGFALWRRANEIAPEAPLPPAPHALRVAAGNPGTLDPGLASSDASAAIIDQLFSGLVEITPDLDVVPGVARTWEVLDDGRRYIFHLDTEARWSDGTPLTAYDFEFAWKRVLEPPFGWEVANILYVLRGARAHHQGQLSTSLDVGVHALDDHTLAVELEEPVGYFLHLLTCCVTYPVPRHLVERHGPAWSDACHLIGNGAFRLVDWHPGQSLELARNPKFHGTFGGNAERIEASISGDVNTALELFEANRLDIINVPLERANEIRLRHATEYVTAPILQTSFIGFDVTRTPFDDVRVRRAFTQALDRDTLANRVLLGVATPGTGGFVPLGMLGHSPAIGLAFDPEQARQALAEAGYPNGQGFPQVEMLVNRGQYASLLADHLLTQWQVALGINVSLRVIAPGTAVAEFNRLRQNSPVALFSSGWVADYSDADNFLRVFVAMVLPWRNAAFEQLLETASHIGAQAERVKLYQAADHILIEEAAVIPLSYGRFHKLVKPWIRHYRLSPMRSWHWKDIVIQPH